MIEQLLHLSGVRVLSAEISQGEMTIEIETTEDHALCHRCSQPATEYYCLGEAIRLRHFPVFNRQVYLLLRPKRYRCLHCDDHPTTTRRDHWHDAQGGVTRASAQFLLLEIAGSTLVPEQSRLTVREVCTDLYEGFANAVKEALPQAKLGADRFHLSKLLRQAIDPLRKSEMRMIKNSLEPELYRAFKGVLWVWRCNLGGLTAEELSQPQLPFQCSPLLRRAHKLREKFYQIFETKHCKQSATRAIRPWIREVRGSGLECFDTFLATLEKWIDEVINYFVSRLSSGWVEGLNNKIKVLERRCYGIKNLSNSFRRIWLDLRGYDAFAH